MRALKLYAILAGLLVLSIAVASAQSATWTFSNGLPGEVTTFTLPADVGGPLSAIFTGGPYNINADGDSFANSGGGAPAFAGNFLIDQTPDSLTIEFPMPVTAVSFDFALTGATDLLDVSTGAGDSTTMAGAQYTPVNGAIGDLWGGMFSWTLPTASSIVNLHGQLAQGGLADLAIDNLTVTAPGIVPEPGTWAFLLAGFLPLAWRLRRRA